MKTFIENLRKKPRAQLFFLTLLVGYSIVNIPALYEEIRMVNGYKRVLSRNIVGYQFLGLEKFVSNVKYLSYFTDTNIKEDKTYKTFTQAQLVLAPTILDPVNMNHKFVLFVCKDKKIPIIWMKKWNMIPIAHSNQGTILAVRR